jgi:hypothetical protein
MVLLEHEFRATLYRSLDDSFEAGDSRARHSKTLAIDDANCIDDRLYLSTFHFAASHFCRHQTSFHLNVDYYKNNNTNGLENARRIH